jgi:hypothetical protein
VTNYGPSATNDTVIVEDDLPAGLAYVSAAGEGAACAASAGLVRCTIADVLEVGDTRDITIVTTVTAAAGATITNEATVRGGVTVDGEPLSADVLAGIADDVTDPASGLGEALGIDPPATGIAAQDETPAATILAFTGLSADRLVSLAFALVALGLAMVWLGRRGRRIRWLHG